MIRPWEFLCYGLLETVDCGQAVRTGPRATAHDIRRLEIPTSVWPRQVGRVPEPERFRFRPTAPASGPRRPHPVPQPTTSSRRAASVVRSPPANETRSSGTLQPAVDLPAPTAHAKVRRAAKAGAKNRRWPDSSVPPGVRNARSSARGNSREFPLPRLSAKQRGDGLVGCKRILVESTVLCQGLRAHVDWLFMEESVDHERQRLMYGSQSTIRPPGRRTRAASPKKRAGRPGGAAHRTAPVRPAMHRQREGCRPTRSDRARAPSRCRSVLALG